MRFTTLTRLSFHPSFKAVSVAVEGFTMRQWWRLRSMTAIGKSSSWVQSVKSGPLQLATLQFSRCLSKEGLSLTRAFINLYLLLLGTSPSSLLRYRGPFQVLF